NCFHPCVPISNGAPASAWSVMEESLTLFLADYTCLPGGNGAAAPFFPRCAAYSTQIGSGFGFSSILPVPQSLPLPVAFVLVLPMQLFPRPDDPAAARRLQFCSRPRRACAPRPTAPATPIPHGAMLRNPARPAR